MKVKPGCVVIAAVATVFSMLYLVYLLRLHKGLVVVQVSSPRISSRKTYYDSKGMHTEELVVTEIALSTSSKSMYHSEKGRPGVVYADNERYYTTSMLPLQISYPASQDTIEDRLERATALSQHTAQTGEVEDVDAQKTRISQETTLMSYDVTTTSVPLNQSLSVSSIPFMGNYNCTDSLCSQFLLPGSSCTQSVHRYVNRAICHFMNATNRAPVALASFPGSGNTWVRGLLEQATRICTGSVYCDGFLRSSGFIGEGMNNAAVIAVKTHNFNTNWKKKNYGSAILIIRNPFDALVAEWSRQRTAGSHTRGVPDQIFGESYQWDRFIEEYLSWWVPYFRTWYINGTAEGNPVLVVRFEDLKDNPIVYTKKMLSFLHFPNSDDEVHKRMEGFEDHFGYKFHRRHNNDSFDHFTKEQKEKVISCIQTAVELLHEENDGETFGIEEYLLHQ